MLGTGINLKAITSTTRTIEKKKLPKPEEVFKFNCGGVVGGDSQLSGKRVEWKAEFKRPLEELVYPSLQRFDNAGYEEKKKQYRRLHGATHSSLTIKLEPLPDEQLPKNEQIMFLHTPSWTLSLRDAEEESEDLRSQRSGRVTVKAIEEDGEKLLRAQVKDRFREKLEIDRLTSELQESPSSKDRNRASLDLNLLRLRKNANMALGLHEDDNADQLYFSLTNKRKNLLNPWKAADQDSPIDKPDLTATKSSNKLNAEVVTDATVYTQQKKLLHDLVPSHMSHIFDGLLYYRMNHELNKVEEAERQLHEQKLMSVAPRVSKRFSNTFNSRLAARKSIAGMCANANLNEMHAVRDEDVNLINSKQLASVPEVSFTRIRQVTERRKIGVQATDMVPPSSSRRTLGSSSVGIGGGSVYSGTSISRYSHINKPPTTQPLELEFAWDTDEQGDNDCLYWGANGGEAVGPQSPESCKRRAQDALLLTQLDLGVLPEQFIKKEADAQELTVDLSNYGIGDTRGECLGVCLGELEFLQSVGLSDNRLTMLSIPGIVQNLSLQSVMHLDLSFNHLHDGGVGALAEFFRERCVLQYLDISNCGIQCEDVKGLFNILSFYPNQLEQLYLSCNKIAQKGASDLCQYLTGRQCRLLTLDLSWNNIGQEGAVDFATSLPLNTTLLSLNLASNGLGDSGAQRLAASLAQQQSLEDLNLSQNGVSDRTSFVLSQVLASHVSLRKVDLSLNPLGEAGARALFRTILRGLRCFVIMRGCSYQDDPFIFNNTHPTKDNPYTLDFNEPYQRAVFAELLRKVRHDPENCRFERLVYRESPKAPEVSWVLTVVDNEFRFKASGERWEPPQTGVVRFSYYQSVFVPTKVNAVAESPLNVLQIIIENGRTEADRKTWLHLLCQDLYFTTAQAQMIIDRFIKNKTIGPGGISKLDIIKSLWRFFVDTENMFDFLIHNADAAQRKDLVYTLTVKRYKFNWTNPTGHWILNLGDKQQNDIMRRIIAINNSESGYSRLYSTRGDTSQYGNWYNFRNSKYSTDAGSEPLVIDQDFLDHLPLTGILEFDYVSTSRPGCDSVASLHSVNFNSPLPSPSRKSKSKPALSTPVPTFSPRRPEGPSTPEDPGKRVGSSSTKNALLVDPVDVVSDDEFFFFLQKLGLSSRHKVPASTSLVVIMDLQLASTRYYFSIEQVQAILDSFVDEWAIQARVFICMFGRIKELHNIDLILRTMEHRTQQEILFRLGCLNVINPLKISMDYELSLKYLDNRILLVALMELASIESADQIIEDPATELPIATMYGSYTRAVNETRPETMRFTFTDFGVRTMNVSWSSRKDLVKKFLVGTAPLDENLYAVIGQYKEMDAANFLTRGPLDQQYLHYQKMLRSSSMRAQKSQQTMLAMMRNSSQKKTLGSASSDGSLLQQDVTELVGEVGVEIG